MKLAHFFFPHPKTHKKAHLLSTKALLIYIAFFLTLQLFFTVAGKINPNVLGASTTIDYKEIIRLTNVEREKDGLAPLKENAKLNVAAYQKGENMFEENYWAHYSPSGKDPWGFIRGAGYNFSYAGENLARNFSSAQDVVNAWMASPSHKENILNTHYTEIGISVVEGQLQNKDTILVVQEFGRPTEIVAQAPEDTNKTPPTQIVETPPQTDTIPTQPVTQTQPVQLPVQPAAAVPVRIDPLQINKTFGVSMIVFLGFLILFDLIALRKRSVYNLASRHAPHFALLGVAASTLIHSPAGQITQTAVSIVVGK